MISDLQKQLFDDAKDKYRKYDGEYLHGELKRLRRTASKDENDPDTAAIFAIKDILGDRSKEKLKDKVFSKSQASLLLFFTGVLAFCAASELIGKIIASSWTEKIIEALGKCIQ